MRVRSIASLVGVAAAVAVAAVLGGCTPGGQFDPTELLSSDVFGTKKRLQGDREPLFPNGVPGTETGVPADLVKGYQPPPEPAENAELTPPAPPAPAAQQPAKPKPPPKPKPAVASVPPPKPTTKPAQAAWPAPPPAGAAAQTNWPNPQQPAGQTNWPAPPPTGQGQQARPPQPNWPSPPPSGTAPGAYSH